jgi:hypothetical protein
MRRITPNRLLIVTTVLVALAITALIADARLASSRRDASVEFQQLLGGLGFGPALDLVRDSSRFDPRLGYDGPEINGPIPRAVEVGSSDPVSISSHSPIRRPSQVGGAEE